MTTDTPSGESVVAKLSKGDWVAIFGIAATQVCVILGWGVSLDRRVTKMEAVVESYHKPMEDATANSGILQRIDQSLTDIARRLDRLEDGRGKSGP